MQISIMEISMSLNGNLELSWGITQPTEKNTNQDVQGRCHLRFFFNDGHQTTQYLNLMDSFGGHKTFFGDFTI